MIDQREKRIYELSERDPRFRPQAYFFIYMALARARLMFGRDGHIRGRELLAAFAEEARSQYGPTALTVLRHLGFRTTRDVGELVFGMVAEGLLSKTAEDLIEDFDAAYEFEDEFGDR